MIDILSKKIWVVIFLVIIIIIIFVSVFTSQSFKKSSDVSQSKDTIITDYNYYYGYELIWQGFIYPKIKDVALIDKESNNNKLDKNIEYSFFINVNKISGLVGENAYRENPDSYQYVPVRNYEVTSDEITLVGNYIFLTQNLDDHDFELVITYTVLGIPMKDSFEVMLVK